MWRALIESLACWARQNLAAIEAATGQPIEHLTLIGGSARSALLPQTLADITGRAVALPEVAEASALGAALLAGRALGLPSPPPASTRLVEPDARRSAWYDRFYREVYAPLYNALRPINAALAGIGDQELSEQNVKRKT
jgi:sugar (pentulose or hexulose) kinase